MKFIVEKELSHDEIENLLCSAFEGGSNYWASAKPGKKPSEKCDYLFQWPLHGGSFIIVEMDEDLDEKDWKEHEVNGAALQHGLGIMADLKPGEGGHHIYDALKGDTDAVTGDVFLQCCALGEVVYG